MRLKVIIYHVISSQERQASLQDFDSRGLAMGGNSGSWLRTGRSSGYGGRAFVRVARLVHGVVDVSEAHPQGAGAIRVLPARLPPQRSRRHVHEVLHVHVEVALLVAVSAVHALRDLRGSLATSR